MNVPEELKKLQIDSVDQLISLKEQREVVLEHLKKLEDKQESVTKIVFDRIRKDYAARVDALDQEAVPLKETARRSYVLLQDLLDHIRDEHRSLLYAKEEIEVRNAIGELTDKDLNLRLKEIEEELQAWDEHLGEAEAVEKKFLAAVESPQELKSSKPLPAEPLPAEPLPPKPPSVLKDPDSLAPVGLQTSEKKEVRSIAEEEDALLSESNTMALSEVSLTDRPIFNPPAEELEKQRLKSSPGTKSPGPTKIMKLAMLLPADESGDAYAVEPVSSIGRQVDNTIQIDQPSVSRYHAEIELTEEGYFLRDKSQNGTFVNRERVQGSRLLQNQDELIFGDVTFSFQCDDKDKSAKSS